MYANVAFQVGGANRARVEDTVWPEKRNLHVFRTILAEGIDGEQQDIGVKLFCTPPNEPEAAHCLIACQRVAGRGLYVLHVAAENRGKEAGEELRDRSDQILDRKSTRLNSSHVSISYAVFCLKKKK